MGFVPTTVFCKNSGAHDEFFVEWIEIRVFWMIQYKQIVGDVCFDWEAWFQLYIYSVIVKCCLAFVVDVLC